MTDQPLFHVLLSVSAAVPQAGTTEPQEYPIYEYYGKAENASLLLGDLHALGSTENLVNIQEAVVRFYREDLKAPLPDHVPRVLHFAVADSQGAYVAFARNCGCPVAVWEDDLAPSMQARLFQEHIQKGLIIQHVPGRFIRALMARNLECPHNQGNPGLWDQPIENATGSLAALRIDTEDRTIQGNRLGLLALIDALQRALAEGNACLAIYDPDGKEITLQVSFKNL